MLVFFACMFTVYACIELHTIQIHTTKTKSTHSKPVMQWNNTNSKAYLTHISIYEFIFIFLFYFELNFLICILKHMCYQARSYFKFIWIRRMIKLLSSFIHSFGIKRAYDVKDSCTSHRHRPLFAYFFDCLCWLKRQHVVWISLMHKTCNSSFWIKIKFKKIFIHPRTWWCDSMTANDFIYNCSCFLEFCWTFLVKKT